MFSLRWKLGGALLLVVLISVGIMAYLTNQNTASQFQQYVQTGGQIYLQRLVSSLQQYYSSQKNWDEAQDILTASLRSSSDRLVLADNAGKIVGDTSRDLLGKTANQGSLSGGIPITVAGQNAGMLYPFLSGQAGRGYMGGMGMMGNTGAQSPTAEQNFLSRTNSYLWIAGAIAFVLALLLGLLLTRQVTRPIKALTIGAKHISEGDLSHRVKIHSRDEIGQLAESFNNMAVKLDNSEQSRKRLVSDVAHELRTPLTIIQGTVDGIKDGVFPADKDHLDSIKEQTVLLTYLVNDLRELSLADSGKLKLEFALSDIIDLVRRKLTQFEVNARQKNIRMTLDTPSKLPEISIDSRRMEQVIGNLLSNAIRHTPEDGQITVSLRVTDINSKTGKDSVVISVTDTGEGIPAENLPYIFERFYRIETSRSRSEGGAGLGLAIVKQMVQAHGGQVWVESQPGRGSTFSLSLPLRK